MNKNKFVIGQKEKNIWWKQSKCCFWLIAKQQEDDYLYFGNHIYQVRIMEKKIYNFSSLAKIFKKLYLNSFISET